MIPSTLTIAGVDVSGVTRYEVSVTVGRDDTDTQPDANVMECLLTDWTAVGTVDDPVILADGDGQLFAGRITDLVTEFVGGEWESSVTAVSALSDLGRTVIGDEPWPQETDSLRIVRILDLAAAAHDVDPGVLGPLILGRDVDRKSALELAQEVASDALGVLWEDPAAAVDPIRYTPQRLRGWSAAAVTWAETRTETWTSVDPAVMWATATTDNVGADNPMPTLTLDAGLIRAEIVLEQRVGDLIRRARVEYGPEPAEGEVRAEAVYGAGVPEIKRDTQLADQTDAQATAELIVRGHQEPRWQLREATIPLHAVDAGMRSTIRGALAVGTRVTINRINFDAPIGTSWQGYLEGWRHELDNHGEHRLVMRLSDRVLTEPADRWQDVAVIVTWDTVDPALTWDRATAVGAA